MSSKHVFKVTYWPEGTEHRPVFDFTLPGNQTNWDLTKNVIEGELPKALWPPLHVIVNEDDALEWDAYLFTTFPMFSQRAAEALAPYITPCFEFVPATINGVPYHVLRLQQALDCFDRRSSRVELYPDDPQSILFIEEYAFFKDRILDPSLFCIPECWALFATEGIVSIVEQNHLRGFQFDDTDETIFGVGSKKKKSRLGGIDQ